MRSTGIALAVYALGLIVASEARAGLGTVWVNFGGQVVTAYPNPATSNPPTTFNAFTLQAGASSLFGTLTDATDKTNVQNAIVADMNADYAGLGAAFTLTQPASGSYSTLVIGNPNGGDTTNLYGQTDNIDFRHKVASHTVGVSVTAHSNHAAPGTGWDVASVAQVIANTASHELGHSFGLVHSDVVSTYTDTVGTVAQKQAAVQGNEMMVKNPNNTNFFADLNFGRYSRIKLDVASNGVNVETEDGTAAFKTAAAADPARAGDAGATVAAATPLVVDANLRDTVLGNLAASDTDIFKFTGVTGQRVTAEAFSITLSQRIADTVDNFNIDLIDSLGNVLATAGPGSSNINGGEFDGIAGADTESRSLLFEYQLTANDTYGFRLTGAGADKVGDYELFVMVPEPAAISMLMAAASLGLLRRRKVD